MLISSCPTAIGKGLNCICTRTSQTSVPVTTFLFGNNSQTQLNDIWTSNRTNTSAVGSWSTSTCAKGRPLRNYHKSGCSDKPFSCIATSGKQIDAFFPSAGSREETILISTDTIANLQVTNLPLSMPNHFTYMIRRTVSITTQRLWPLEWKYLFLAI